MEQPESRAVWRAVIILVLVSLVRWASATWHDEPVGEGANVLPELAAASRAGAAEAERRSEPLAEGERLDPNRASETELDRLPGVGPATAAAIAEARRSGTVFRRPEDLLEVKGIGGATLERVRPLLDLSSPPLAVPRPLRTAADRTAPVDLNRADPETLQTLPGIGPALAERIVAARRERSFRSVDDLARVQGIGAATVGRLRPFTTVR